MLRILDCFFAFIGLLITSPLLILVYIIGLFDTGSPIFKQTRIGRNKKEFTLVKFRTMKIGTSSVASHLASSDSITSLGAFLRRSKLDELPQLWNVLIGDMSIVGPRPGLKGQTELISFREKYSVYIVRPGITGLAQISGVDMSTPEHLAKIDSKMIVEMSLFHYLKYMIFTLFGKGYGDAADNVGPK